MTRPLVVFNIRKTGKYAVNVLLGAMEKLGLDQECDVEVIDRPARLAPLLDANPGRDILCAWTFFSAGFPAVAEERAALGERTGVIHVAGGVHASAEPGEVLRAGFSRVALGDGERSFTTMVRRFLAGAPFGAIPGTAELDGAGRLVRHGPPDQVELDDWPAFYRRTHRYNPIEITRGCVYACRFCQTPFMFKARFRHRSLDNIREHVRIYAGRGMRDLRTITPTALSWGADGTEPELDAIEALLAMMREEMGPFGRVFFGSFPAEVRPEHVSEKALLILKRFVDNDNIVMGAQSGSDRLLTEMRRGHGTAEVEHAVRLIVAAGFLPIVDVIFGLPGEREEDALATLHFAQRLADLGASVRGHTFLPLPGTPWKDAPAGHLGEAARRLLGRLAASGAVQGYWHKQEAAAADLAAMAAARRG